MKNGIKSAILAACLMVILSCTGCAGIRYRYASTDKNGRAQEHEVVLDNGLRVLIFGDIRAYPNYYPQVYYARENVFVERRYYGQTLRNYGLRGHGGRGGRR